MSLSDYVKNTDYIVYGSFIEIYNEKIYDLLVSPTKTGKRDDLRIRQDEKGPFVGNALEIQINTAQASFQLCYLKLWGPKRGVTPGVST